MVGGPRTERMVVCLCVGAWLGVGCGRMSFDEEEDDGLVMLEIELGGSGTGTIVGTDGVQCSAGCSIEVPAGTAVTLRGLAAEGSWLAGWTGPCGGNFECRFVADTDTVVRADFGPQPNRIFLASTPFDGALGGVAAADATCAQLAESANLQGAFIAFLSAGGVDARDRLAGSRGWVRVDGAPVADTAQSLATGPIWFSPRLDELGTDMGMVWVHRGAPSANNCVNWTSNLATENVASVSSAWGSVLATDVSMKTCDLPHQLLCIETGRNVPIAPYADDGKLAFVTAATWTSGAGRASADALCASEAQAAGETGAFLAALATTTESIASRFPAGGVWRRLDGVRIVRDEGIFERDYLDVAPEVDIAGNHVDKMYWTGAPRWNLAPDASGNCADWTTADSVATTAAGYTSTTDVSRASKTIQCSTPMSLLCLEQ